MEGYEATRRIKADPAIRSIPIIAVTSYALSGEEKRARGASCDDYVPTRANCWRATMLVFGFGAALPLVFVGLLSRETLLRWRARLIAGGAGAKVALAIMLVSIGALVPTGLDKRIETGLVDVSPERLTNITHGSKIK
jgi:hypothetical protein